MRPFIVAVILAVSSVVHAAPTAPSALRISVFGRSGAGAPENEPVQQVFDVIASHISAGDIGTMHTEGIGIEGGWFGCIVTSWWASEETFQAIFKDLASIPHDPNLTALNIAPTDTCFCAVP